MPPLSPEIKNKRNKSAQIRWSWVPSPGHVEEGHNLIIHIATSVFLGAYVVQPHSLLTQHIYLCSTLELVIFVGGYARKHITCSAL